MILAGWAEVFAFKILSGWAEMGVEIVRHGQFLATSLFYFWKFLILSLFKIWWPDRLEKLRLCLIFFWLTVYIETGLVYLLLLLLMLLLLLDTCKTCKLANFSGDKTFWRQNLKKFSAEFRPKASLQLRFKLKVIV